VAYKREEQVLFGNGISPNLTGIVPQAAPFNAGLITIMGVASPTKLDAIRAASLQVRQARYPNQAFVLNPQDWAEIELIKDSTGKYVWVSVPEGGVARLWRVPVIESDMITAGEFLCGAFARGATLFAREGASISISESHGEYFAKNLIAIRCELRCALAVTRPQAFVAGSFPEEE